MARSLIFLLLGGIVLAQCGQLVRSANASSSEESNEKVASAEPAKTTPRMELLSFTLRNFKPLFDSILLGHDEFKVLKEPENSHLRIELDELLSRLSEYFEKVNTPRKQSEQLRDKIKNDPKFSASEQGQLLAELFHSFFKATSEFADIAEQYNTTTSQPEKQNLEIVLLRNRYERMSRRFAEVFANFKPRFHTAMDHYIAELSPEEVEKNSELIKWYEQFKSEPKLQKFVRFIELFSAQDFSDFTRI